MAEALRAYLKAYEAKRLAEERVQVVDDLMVAPHRELVHEIGASKKEVTEANEALEKVSGDADPRIERTRTLRELKKRLEGKP